MGEIIWLQSSGFEIWKCQIDVSVKINLKMNLQQGFEIYSQKEGVSWRQRGSPTPCDMGTCAASRSGRQLQTWVRPQKIVFRIGFLCQAKYWCSRCLFALWLKSCWNWFDWSYDHGRIWWLALKIGWYWISDGLCWDYSGWVEMGDGGMRWVIVGWCVQLTWLEAQNIGSAQALQQQPSAFPHTGDLLLSFALSIKKIHIVQSICLTVQSSSAKAPASASFCVDSLGRKRVFLCFHKDSYSLPYGCGLPSLLGMKPTEHETY